MCLEIITACSGTVKPSRSVFSASFVKTALCRLIVGLLRINPPWYPRWKSFQPFLLSLHPLPLVHVVLVTNSQFLCAFVVGIPIASTLKTRERIRVQELLRTVQSDLTRSDLEQLSDQAIDWIQEHACQDSANQDIVGVLKEPKVSKLHHLTRVNARHFHQTSEMDL